MTALWLLFTALMAVALLFVILPLWRFRAANRAEDARIRQDKNIEVFNQGVVDLDHDLEEGLIGPEQYEKLKAELQRAFLRDMEANERSARKLDNPRLDRSVPLVLTLVLALGTIWMYQQIGAGRDLMLPELMGAIATAEDADAQRQNLENLADALQDRMRRHPEDVQNGYMLGTLYVELGQFRHAIDTFNALLPHVPTSADRATIFGQLAQSSYLAAEQNITPEVRGYIDQALALNPNESSTLSLLAIDAFWNEDFDTALSLWRRQLAQANPSSAEARTLRERISRIETLLAQSDNGSAGVMAAVPAQDQEGAAATGITVRVELAPELMDQASPDMVVFIFARGDIPMPLAAVRATVADLPMEVFLDDSKPMAQGMPVLSSAENVVVGARISESGNAIAQSGDYQAVTEPFPLREQSDPIVLIIKDRVP